MMLIIQVSYLIYNVSNLFISTFFLDDNLLYISRGQATVYDLSDNNVSFNSDDSTPQIIEIPSKKNIDYSSDDSCPQLVPITQRHTKKKVNSSSRKSKKSISYSSDESCPQLVPIETTADAKSVDTFSTPTKNRNTYKPKEFLCAPISVTTPIAHKWQKCPITVLNANENQHNVSIENIISNMSSKNICFTDQVQEQMEIDEEMDIAEELDSNEDSLDNAIIKAIESELNSNEKPLQFETLKDKKKRYKFEQEIEQANESINYDEDVVDPIIQPKFFNSLNSRQVLLVLKSEIHFHGVLRITLLAGTAQVYGYDLKLNKTITAYSPRGYSFINITPTYRTETKNIKNQLDDFKCEFLQADIKRITSTFNASNDALLLLERETGNKSINMIEKYMKQTVFPNINAFNSRRAFYSSEFILHCIFYLKSKTKLTTSSEWHSIGMSTDSKIMVIGGKGVGKSTLVRHLVNSNLEMHNKILLIDLDIGQPELFVPQTVSAVCLSEPILGPGYLLNKSPDRAYLFGDINVVVSPIKYLNCVLRLLKFCQEAPEYQNIPWIINTMGYNRGFGLELTAVILKALQPTDLIQISSHRELDNFDRILTSDEVNAFNFNIFQSEVNDIASKSSTLECSYQTHVWESLARKFGEKKNDWDMSARDLRFIIILANLGKLLKGTAEWITDVKPCW